MEEAEREFVVGLEAAGQRLDVWLVPFFPEESRSRIQNWIREGRVMIDGMAARASHQTAPGERVILRLPRAPSRLLEPQQAPFDVLYEDEHVMVLMKPAGLQVHPGAGAPRVTLVHALLHRDPSWVPPGPPERPGIVHRLDRDTSGLLLIARSPLAYQNLVQQIMARQVTRRYVALAWGNFELGSGRMTGAIGRDRNDRRRMAVVRSGRAALTSWQVLRRFDSLTLLDIVLGTGRTHQIRVHLSHGGHPVFGDPVYGGGRGALTNAAEVERPFFAGCLGRLRRQALHAYHLAFRHPVGGEGMRFEAPVPDDMDLVLQELVLRDLAQKEPVT